MPKPGDAHLPGESTDIIDDTPSANNNNNIKYKEPSAKAKLARLKQDILGDGVKESKLEKYVELSSGGSGSNDLAIALIEKTASEVVIPKGTTKIGNGVFSLCQDLRTVVIPNTVTYIDASAFWNCTSLSSVTIGNSVTSIGQEAFSGCTNLHLITIPSSVTFIDDNAFYDCEELGVRCEAVVPPRLGSMVFNSISFIDVPGESVDAYKAAEGWSEYASSIRAMKVG